MASISLKIPDNAAYTALTALRRLGIEVERLERSEIWRVEDRDDAATFARRLESNETIFNPNKHRLIVLEDHRPRAGEAWIEEIGAHDQTREHLGGRAIPGITHARRYVGWRLMRANGAPGDTDAVRRACELLLANPAIEIAHTRDIEAE